MLKPPRTVLIEGIELCFDGCNVENKNPFFCVNLYDKNRRTEYCEVYLSHIYYNISKATIQKVAQPLTKDEKFLYAE
jgi:hypothetical protein